MTDVTTSAAPGRKILRNVSVRWLLGQIHLWTGIIFCIPFVLLGVSGSVLMIEHDTPNRFVADPAAGTYKSVNEIIEAARAVAPPNAVASGYDAPPATGEPAIVRFTMPRREGEGQAAPRPGPQAGSRVEVDPVSLSASLVQPRAVGNVAGGYTFERLMHDMHGRMLISGPNGRAFVGWLGVFMTFLGFSGIVLWWPKKGQWKSAFSFRCGQSALRVNREIHGAIGIWGLIVFIIVSISGVYICFPQTINDVVDASPAVRDMRNQQPFNVTPIEGETPLDADAAVALAKGAVEGGIVRTITLPATPTQPYRVAMSREGEFNGTPRATVIIDPWQKAAVEVRDPASYTTMNKFLSWQRQMHAGNGLGWIWWILVLLSGFLPLVFVITGLSMWLLKRRNKRRVAAQG